jgi:hypothetical protein
MLKPKSLINIFWIMTILFLCHSIDPSTVFAFNYPNGNENVIVDTCPPENSGQSSGGVSTVSGDHNYPPDWSCPENLSLEYDTANSNETIDRNGTGNLVITGDDGPYYTWSVSGQGFWFDANYTIKTLTNNGITATLYADGTACGSATITITACGVQAKGYVRCTTGKWAECAILCDGTHDGTCWAPGSGACVKIEGNRKYWTEVRDNRYGWYGSCCDEVEDGCNLGECQWGPICSTAACDVVSTYEQFWVCP